MRPDETALDYKTIKGSDKCPISSVPMSNCRPLPRSGSLVCRQKISQCSTRGGSNLERIEPP